MTKALRISGKDFKEFYTNHWPENYLWEDSSTYTPDGSTTEVELTDANDEVVIKDDEIFTVPDYWYIYDETGENDAHSMTDLLRKFLETKTHSQVIVNLPKEKVALLQEFLNSINEKDAIQN